ncbi:hypothetical protein DL240_17030 [Lujinxingia litoralis]|uniref:Thioredoxin domain-containing protein n=1 Tax=Lujinxingia litoralis TaxID=2211119 RepID=A0A328C249_9DELT|nr:thioredoxin domain-containing protein [Lujinxingia litoralis]RAL20503.1 hypothetical protein DL240_17030 [Lujinxingia litoralis]
MRRFPLAPPNQPSMFASVFCGGLLALTLAAGCASGPRDVQTPAELAPQWVESELVPLGDSPRQGQADAPVVIVEFSSLQCPFSARARQTTAELLERYPGQVQLVYKHLPLEFQPQAHPAARVAEAAARQEAFWPMVESLYASQRTLAERGAESTGRELAGRIGLDEGEFAEALGAGDELDVRIARDVALAQKLGISGTPTFLINGEPVLGAQPLEVFEDAVARALARDATLKEQGVASSERYARSVELAQVQARQQQEEEARRRAEAERQQAPQITYVPVQGDELIHQHGEAYLVTLVEFSSLQCPFCARVVPTLTRLKEEYGETLRVVYKHFPLNFQEHSELAARAVVAASEQNQGWEMRDAIYARQRELSPELIDVLAQELGLDMDAFSAALASPEAAARVARDLREGMTLGVRGTPAFFVNGVFLAGARPYEQFKALIDHQIEQAQELRQAEPELTGEELYLRAVEQAQEQNAP